MAAEVKTIGSSGQISLGKGYAGRTVLVEQIEDGVWLVKSAKVIPDSESWLHEPAVRARLDRAIAWAETHPPAGSDLEQLAKRIRKRR